MKMNFKKFAIIGAVYYVFRKQINSYIGEMIVKKSNKALEPKEEAESKENKFFNKLFG